MTFPKALGLFSSPGGNKAKATTDRVKDLRGYNPDCTFERVHAVSTFHRLFGMLFKTKYLKFNFIVAKETWGRYCIDDKPFKLEPQFILPRHQRDGATK